MKRFRGGLIFKAHRRVYHSTLGLRVMKKKKLFGGLGIEIYLGLRVSKLGSGFRSSGFRVQGAGSSAPWAPSPGPAAVCALAVIVSGVGLRVGVPGAGVGFRVQVCSCGLGVPGAGVPSTLGVPSTEFRGSGCRLVASFRRAEVQKLPACGLALSRSLAHLSLSLARSLSRSLSHSLSHTLSQRSFLSVSDPPRFPTRNRVWGSG